jgi:hypothetical protein
MMMAHSAWTFTAMGMPGNTAATKLRRQKKGAPPMATMEIWAYREQSLGSLDLTDYGVEALDGSIGKIDDTSNDVGSAYVVVDTGPWIFGKKVMLPAGVISRVDENDEKVYVNRTKEQIKNSPEFDSDNYLDASYRTQLGAYYDQGGAGWQDW